MTDRELLEAAAKAAGIRIQGDADKLVVLPGIHEGGFAVYNDKGGSSLWNPLTDDGDALRLAMKLEFSILPGGGEVEAWPRQMSTESYAHHAVEKYEGDICTATRRAIVRAAAKLGETVDLPSRFVGRVGRLLKRSLSANAPEKEGELKP